MSAVAMAEAAESGATVTVTRADGRVLTGVVRSHPTEPFVYVVKTGRRGRPGLVHVEDVEEVSFE